MSEDVADTLDFAGHTDFGESAWTVGGYPTGAYIALEDRLALEDLRNAH